MIKLIRSLAELQALSTEWNALPGASQNPLLAHEWIVSAAECCHDEDDLCVLALLKNNRLCAVAPLVFAGARGVARLEFIGTSRLYEPAGFLYEDSQALDRLCAALVSLKHPVMLRRIAEPENLPDLLVSAAKGRGYTARMAGSASPRLDIQTTWNHFYSSISSRRRSDFRRVRRQLEARGEVSIDIRKPSPDTLPELLKEAFRVESSGWKGRRGSGLMVNTILRDFFSSYAVRTCRLGNLRLCFLRVDGQPIATQIAVQHANRWWVLKIGFDETWADYSPGMQLMMDTVRHAFESGLGGYEFLGSSEAWLRIWTRQERTYTSLDYYPRTLSGTTALTVDTLARVPGRLIASVKKASDSRKEKQDQHFPCANGGSG